MSKAVLVTGGAGYIGSQTCKLLAQSGFLPVTYDNLVYGHRHAVKWGPFVEGDLSDKELLLKTISQPTPMLVNRWKNRISIFATM
jgi:UDP-glucose 4-epimerase